nr:unnamed protein product [Spirometra erinaceieuropaei]
MSHDQATAKSIEMLTSVNTVRGSICRHLSTEALTKASAYGVKFDTDADSLLSALRRVFATPKPPVDAYRQFSSRLQLPGESARDYLGCLRPLVLAAFPDQPASLTDVVLAAHFRAGLLDDNLRRKLIKKPNLASEALLTLVQEYEERYGPSVAAPSYSTSVARKRQTRSLATQTFRNFTRPFRGRQDRVAQISSESYTVPSVSSTSDFPAAIVNATVVDRRVAFLFDTGAACSLLNPQGFTRTWLQQTEISHRHPRIEAANGMPLSCSSLVDVPFRLGSSEFTYPFYVCPDIQWQGILGADVLYAHRFCVDFAAGQLTSKSTTIPFYFPHAPDPQLLCDSVGLHPSQPSDLVHLVPDSPGFSSEQITAVRNLIFKNSAAFAWDGEPLGRTSVWQHTIDTGSARPIRQPPRRVPVHFQKQLEQTNKDMLDKHVIRPSSSPWASPIVLVKKNDGSLRLCVDYRKLNAVTVKDSFPLPRIDTTLEALAGAACFSTLDLQSGYWQVEMAPEDRPKTAFSIPSGFYEFETMPFGLANAPATFQRLMASVLRDLCPTACLVYLDDVIVHGSTVESHLDNLQTVFNRLQAVGLKLNPAKCCFLKKSVPFLGHIVSTEGVKTDPVKTEQIRSWPQLTSVSELRGFLGLASYYRRFIKDFAHIPAPLNRLTSKQNAFNWSDECECSFEELKRRLISPPLLAFPNISESAPPFILDTDASDVAIGAVLSQQQTDGLEHPLIFASQTLTKPERNYSTTRKELLAVVTFVKKFHHYLAGKRFILRTDHQALRWLENFKDPTGQLARSWNILTLLSIGPGAPKPSSEEMKGSSWEARCLWSAWNSLRLCDGVRFLQYSPTDPRRLVLPHDAIHPTLSRLHVDLGHAGQARTDTAVRQCFWCPNQRRIIQDICNTCPVCAEVKNPNPTQRAPLQPIQAGYPNEIVGVDLMVPMPPSPSGNRYILVLVGFSTKWCEAVPLPQADAITVAKAILGEWICRHGLPKRLHSDQGAQFESPSDDPEGLTFAAHFNKLKPYALDDGSCGPVSSELPSFPSAELPHPPTDPSSIVSVPTSPPAPAVPSPPLSPVLCPR